MSGFQEGLMIQSAHPDTSLTGSFYRVVQAEGPQGSNVLQLIPLLKVKDNLSAVTPSPVVPGVSSQSLPQPARVSLPSPDSSPPPISAGTVPALGNYIIATQTSPTNAPKTIRVESRFSPAQDTAAVLEKLLPNLPTHSSPVNHALIMNTNSSSFHVKPTPMLPLGHRLQIPAHAEVKAVPASSLPPSIQQKILAQTGCSDPAKTPPIIYVSPVNTVKTLGNQLTPLSPKPNVTNIALLAKPLPVLSTPGRAQPTSKADSPKGPMKWVVQETKESAACLVPVSSSNDTASKILQMLSGNKTEEIKLARSDSSKVMQIKDNALVMCNNKIFFLTKKGTELVNTGDKNPDTSLFTSPTKSPTESESTKDLSNKVVEVVLSKNNLSPLSKPPPSPGNSPSAISNVSSPIKPNRTPLLYPSRNESTVLSIPGNADGDKVTRNKKHGLRNPSVTTKVSVADKGLRHQGLAKNLDQVIKTPTRNTMDDGYWREKFGLVKKETVVLKRMPLLQAESTPRSRRLQACAQKSAKDSVAQPRKRRSPITETALASKRTTRSDGTATQPGAVTADGSGDCISAADALWSPYGTDESPSSSGSANIFIGQDITGHFSEITQPRQRFHCGTLPSAYVDETAKDEKIQRLKEVLKEREQALEALRNQKKH